MAGQPNATPLEVSRAADIRRVEDKVALPTPQNGVTIVLKVRAVPPVEIMAALDGLPGANVAPAPDRVKTHAEVRDELLRSVGPARRIAEAGILEPAFTFGDAPEDGKAWWDDLLPDNQAAAVAAIMTISGFRGEAAKQAATFPAGTGVEGA